MLQRGRSVLPVLFDLKRSAPQNFVLCRRGGFISCLKNTFDPASVLLLLLNILKFSFWEGSKHGEQCPTGIQPTYVLNLNHICTLVCECKSLPCVWCDRVVAIQL